MENTSDYLMLGLLLICMRYDKKVCYKMWDYTTRQITVECRLLFVVIISEMSGIMSFLFFRGYDSRKQKDFGMGCHFGANRMDFRPPPKMAWSVAMER